jgi:hypothetical protein
MKAPLRFFIVLSISGLTALSARAQENPVIHKNFVGFSLTELPFLDFRFTFERRLTPSNALTFSAGFKPAYKSYADATQVNLGQNTTAWCYRNTANWLYFSAGYRYYFDHRKTIYTSAEIFYKYLWANNIVYSFGLQNDDIIRNQYELRSMSTNLTGLNLLIGKRVTIRFSECVHMGLDIYAGLSLRCKFINTTIYSSYIATHYHDEGIEVVSLPLSEYPAVTNQTMIQGSPQFGINLFFSWK